MQALSFLSAPWGARAKTVPATPMAKGTTVGPVVLKATVPDDGTVALQWERPVGVVPRAWWVLAVRAGAVPGFTSMRLHGESAAYTFTNLGRHQRYRFMVMESAAGTQCSSPWLNVTPRAGLVAAEDEQLHGLGDCVSQLQRLLVMPQDRRLTLYWQLTKGFCERVIIEATPVGGVTRRFELEPEVQSFVLDPKRVPGLANGVACVIKASASFAGIPSTVAEAHATPAPQGEERQRNKSHPQSALVYACLSLTDELDVFGDHTDAQKAPDTLTCGLCGANTAWRDYALRCTGCQTEFISNGRGNFLDVNRLRFGTCRCCMPRKILVQDVGTENLRCVHSGKEYVKLGGQEGHCLIEDLPYGLCQCCRPRRPLHRTNDQSIRCTRSNELHRRSDGDSSSLVLVPSAPVFDAAAIDDLLDKGLADICSTGISKAKR